MSSMRLSELWRTTTFRLTLVYGLVFAVGMVALLGMVYLQSAVYLTRRVDGILNTEADALAASPPAALRDRIDTDLLLNGPRTNVFALFSADGRWIAGNLRSLPPRLAVDGKPIETPPTDAFPAHARLIARRLASGEKLVVGRDVNQLREMRAIIAYALVWSGVLILIVGLASGTALSIAPIRRLRELQATGRDIAAGNLTRRMPISHRNDELDLFAANVNSMMSEIERLMAEVKGSTDTIAHDLRTPLTRARAQLHRLQQTEHPDRDELARVTAEIDEVLERFRALMRISELEARGRRAGFAATDLARVLAQAVELYQPLAEDGDVTLVLTVDHPATIDADAKLMFEAASNLIDNAIKFTGAGGVVQVRLEDNGTSPRIVVEDNGPGIPAEERVTVLQRFYRGERDRLIPGSGLGLAVVSAIVRLHGFALTLSDAGPGLRAVITCGL
jgi:signal transduction histidine kinase